MTNQVAANELIACLVNKTAQLEAMLTIITGEGYKSFTGWSEETQGDYMCACSDMTQTVAKLALDLAKLE